MADSPRRPLKSSTRQAVQDSESPFQRRSTSVAASSTTSRPLLSTTAAILAANAAASLSSSANSPSSVGQKKGRSFSANLAVSHPPRAKGESALKVEQTWLPSFSQWADEPVQMERAEPGADASFDSGENQQEGIANSLASSYSTAQYRTSFGVESNHSLRSVEEGNSNEPNALLNSPPSDYNKSFLRNKSSDLQNSNAFENLRDDLKAPTSSSSSYRSSRTRKTTNVSLSDLVANVSNDDAMRVMQLAMKRAEKKETGRNPQKQGRDTIHPSRVVQDRPLLVTSTSMTNISSKERSDLSVRQRSASHRESFEKEQSPSLLIPHSPKHFEHHNGTVETKETAQGVDRIETALQNRNEMPPHFPAFNSGSSMTSRRTSKSSQGSKISPMDSLNQDAELSDVPEIPIPQPLSEFTLQRSARCKAYLEDRYAYIFQTVSKPVSPSKRFNPIRTMRFIKSDAGNTREQALNDSNASTTPRRRVSVGSVGTAASADPVTAGLNRSESGSIHDNVIRSATSVSSMRLRKRKRLCGWDVDNLDFIHENQYNEFQEAERARKLDEAAVEVRSVSSSVSLSIQNHPQSKNEVKPAEAVSHNSPPPSLRGRDKRRKTWADLGIGIGLGLKKGFRSKKIGTEKTLDGTSPEGDSAITVANAGGGGLSEGDLDLGMFPIQSQDQPQSISPEQFSASGPSSASSHSASATPPVSSNSVEGGFGKQFPDKSNRIRLHTDSTSASSTAIPNTNHNPLSSGTSPSSAFPSHFQPATSHSSSQTNLNNKSSPPSTPILIRDQKRHSIALASGSLGRRFLQIRRDTYSGNSHGQSTVSGTYISASEEDGDSEWLSTSLNASGTKAEGTRNVPAIYLSPPPGRTIIPTGKRSPLQLTTDNTVPFEAVLKSRLFAKKVRAKLRRDRNTESGITSTSDIYDSDSSAQSPISINFRRDKFSPGLGNGFGIFTRSRGTSPKQPRILSVPRRHVFFETDRPKRRRSFDELPRRNDSNPYDPTLTSSDLDLINLKCRRWTIGATSELAGVETLGAPIMRIPAALPTYEKGSFPAAVTSMVNNYNQRRDVMIGALTSGNAVERGTMLKRECPVVFKTLVLREGGLLIDLTVSITDSLVSIRKSDQQKLGATTAKFDNCIRDVKMFLEGLNEKVAQSVNESSSRLHTPTLEQSDRGQKEPLLQDLWSTVDAQERKTGTTWKFSRRAQTDMEAALVSLKELNRLLDEDYLREAKQIEDRLMHINLERSQSRTREFFYAFISFVLEISVWLYWFVNLLGKLRKIPLFAYRYVTAPTLVPLEDAQGNKVWTTNIRDGGTTNEDKRNATELKSISEDHRLKTGFHGTSGVKDGTYKRPTSETAE